MERQHAIALTRRALRTIEAANQVTAAKVKIPKALQEEFSYRMENAADHSDPKVRGMFEKFGSGYVADLTPEEAAVLSKEVDYWVGVAKDNIEFESGDSRRQMRAMINAGKKLLMKLKTMK